MAIELSPFGIRVNCIVPGFIASERVQEWISVEGIERELKDEIPIGKIGYPSEVAALTLFLCSKSAEYITGATINIDGGLSARMAFPSLSNVLGPEIN